MKKIMSVLMVLGALVASAEDSYLYWMIGDTTPYGSSSYNTVRVKATDDSGKTSYLNLYGPGGDTLNSQTISYTDINSVKNGGGALYALLASGTTYSSFVIELLNDSTFVAQSETLSYSEAVAKYYIETANSMQLAKLWSATSFAVPEPNSALLVLLGCAVLGLRRRRLVCS